MHLESPYQYLLEARNTISADLEQVELWTLENDEAHQALEHAGQAACQALSTLVNDDEYWNKFTEPKTKDPFALKRAFGVLRRKHSRELIVPITAKLLILLGFKPPEDAHTLVDDTLRACDEFSTSSKYGLPERAEKARELLMKVKEETCKLFLKVHKSAKVKQKRIAMLKHVLKTVSTALIGGAVSALFTLNFSPSNVVSNAINVMTVEGVTAQAELVYEAAAELNQAIAVAEGESLPPAAASDQTTLPPAEEEGENEPPVVEL